MGHANRGRFPLVVSGGLDRPLHRGRNRSENITAVHAHATATRALRLPKPRFFTISKRTFTTQMQLLTTHTRNTGTAVVKNVMPSTPSREWRSSACASASIL